MNWVSFVAFQIGALIPLFLISRLTLWAFRDNRYTPEAVVSAAGIALVISTVLAGYGMATNGEPAFARAFLSYLVPAMVVVIIDLLRVRRRRLPPKGESRGRC